MPKTTTKAKMLTVKIIRSWNPCFDPVDQGLCRESWEGTIFDILDHPDISTDNKIWCCTRYLPDRELRLFACWCAEQALKTWAQLPEPYNRVDERSINAIKVAKRFAQGKATQEELADAADAARAAASAAYAADAADAAAYAAARAARAADAAYADAAYAAAADAARAAARAARAAYAARAAADAARAAADAARAADAAANQRQLKKLKTIIRMLEHV